MPLSAQYKSIHVKEGCQMAAPIPSLSIAYPPTARLKGRPLAGSLPDCTNAQRSLKIIALPIIFIWHLFPPHLPVNFASQSNCKFFEG